MSSSIKRFERTSQKDDKVFEFVFFGYPKKSNIDYDSIENLLTKMTNNITNKDLEYIVAAIRTILKDFDESVLSIEITPKNTVQSLRYEDKQLISYEKTIFVDELLDNTITIKYYKGKFETTNKLRISDFETMIKIKDNLLDLGLKELFKLANIKPIELNKNDELLCLCYKSFYGVYPDFSSSDINLKFQSMLTILNTFDLCLFDKYNFRLNSKNMPLSLSLSKDINRLKPLGQIESIDSSVKITGEAKKYIELIGEEVRNTLGDKIKTDDLIKIAKILYYRNLTYDNDTFKESVKENCHYTNDEIDQSLKLVKTIKQKRN